MTPVPEMTPTGATVRELALDGDPEEVLHGVASASLGLLEDVLEGDQPDR